jgi:CubicO group peptidase (beta-lactamase class C family)
MKINPEAAGMDPKQLSLVDDHFARNYVDAGKIAGCQIAVTRRGELAHFSSIGRADVARDVPVADDTIWRIYSMTKPIIGVALLSLYERGLFQLTDPVSRFIPSWRDLKVQVHDDDGATRLVTPDRAMNVRDLLMHTSGLGYDVLFPGPSQVREDLTLEELCERLADMPLQFHPGSHWLYSVATDICGRLVEILSGQRFDEYLSSTIFGPLGMVDTGFVVTDDKVSRFAANYRRTKAKELVVLEDPETSAFRTGKRYLSGGGGLVSTTPDYLRFTQMLLNGGELDGMRILGRKTVELMTANHLPGGGSLRSFAVPGAYGEVGFDGMGFGLTVAVAKTPSETGVIGSAGEFMWGGAASTAFWVDPAEELTVVFMTQFMPSGTFNFRGQLKTLIYPALRD